MNVQFLLLLESFDALVRVGFEFVLRICKAGDDLHFADHFLDSVFQLFAVWGLKIGVKKTRLIELEDVLRLSDVLVNACSDSLKIPAQI